MSANCVLLDAVDRPQHERDQVAGRILTSQQSQGKPVSLAVDDDRKVDVDAVAGNGVVRRRKVERESRPEELEIERNNVCGIREGAGRRLRVFFLVPLWCMSLWTSDEDEGKQGSRASKAERSARARPVLMLQDQEDTLENEPEWLADIVKVSP